MEPQKQIEPPALFLQHLREAAADLKKRFPGQDIVACASWCSRPLPRMSVYDPIPSDAKVNLAVLVESVAARNPKAAAERASGAGFRLVPGEEIGLMLTSLHPDGRIVTVPHHGVRVLISTRNDNISWETAAIPRR